MIDETRVNWGTRKLKDESVSYYLRWKGDDGKDIRETIFRTEPKPNKRRTKDWNRRAADAAWAKQKEIDGNETTGQRIEWITASESATQYVQWLASDNGAGEPNAADGTIDNHIRHINSFIEHFAKIGREKGKDFRWLSQMIRFHCANWRNALTERGLQGSTINTMLCSISSWLAWCVENGYLVANPMRGVRRMTVSIHRRTNLIIQTPDDLAGLLASMTGPMKEMAVLAVTLLSHTGIRQGEGRSLRWQDSEAGMLHIPAGQTRTTKLHERWIPLAPRLEDMIHNMRGEREGHAAYILTGQRGKKMSTQLNKWFAPHNVSPHDLRRFFQTGMETISAPQCVIDDLMGHCPGAVRAAYTPVSNPELAKRWITRFERWIAGGR